MRARVMVTLKKGVLDPQGDAILTALRMNDLKNILSARQGKVLDLEVEANNLEEANLCIRQACDLLLVNPLIEEVSWEIASCA